MKNDTAIFEGHGIRRVYDEKTEMWFFSVVDIIQVLTQQPDYKAAQNYWKVLKHRLKKEGSQSVTNCNQLKLKAADGKNYLTDVFTALAELSTRQIAETVVATGLDENKKSAKTGGNIAKRARLELEAQTGKPVVTDENYLPPGNIKKIPGVKNV